MEQSFYSHTDLEQIQSDDADELEHFEHVEEAPRSLGASQYLGFFIPGRRVVLQSVSHKSKQRKSKPLSCSVRNLFE